MGSAKGTIVVTGSNGLIGSSVVRKFHSMGFRVLGIDNDSRGVFFGPQASTAQNGNLLQDELQNYKNFSIDIRDVDSLEALFQSEGEAVVGVIHAAAQPSHEWAKSNPGVDFDVNARGTLNILESVRLFSPDAVFIFLSTNKVYGDGPNNFNYDVGDLRFSPADNHPFEQGFNESLSVDNVMHSLFGVSKLSADLLVQEYGRYFDLSTAVLRGGCLTGRGHMGVQLHGFLSYLVKCAVSGTEYSVFGYDGKQVRDNIHSDDVAEAIACMVIGTDRPAGGPVYNIGGGEDNISILEAITFLRETKNFCFDVRIEKDSRPGDHQWYITDMSKFISDYPAWRKAHNMESILEELIAEEVSRESG